MTTTRHILIVEDQPETVQWLQECVLAAWPMAICHPVASLHEARQWQQAAPSPWTLALIDLGLPDGSGAELVAELRHLHPEVTAVVTTIFDDDDHLFKALAAGAQGYLLKDAERQEIEHSLRALDAGIPSISPAIARRILAYFHGHASTLTYQANHTDPHLTPRELEVLRYIGRGLRVLETARLLNLSENTVSGYVKSLYRKLNVSSRAEAALEAARRGLV